MAADDGQYLTEEAIAIRSSVRTCEANARYDDATTPALQT